MFGPVGRGYLQLVSNVLVPPCLPNRNRLTKEVAPIRLGLLEAETKPARFFPHRQTPLFPPPPKICKSECRELPGSTSPEVEFRYWLPTSPSPPPGRSVPTVTMTAIGSFASPLRSFKPLSLLRWRSSVECVPCQSSAPTETATEAIGQALSLLKYSN